MLLISPVMLTLSHPAALAGAAACPAATSKPEAIPKVESSRIRWVRAMRKNRSTFTAC
ncbi:hypothetical protein WDZ92_29350 [Nostoc sp. NIES-2111]